MKTILSKSIISFLFASVCLLTSCSIDEYNVPVYADASSGAIGVRGFVVVGGNKTRTTVLPDNSGMFDFQWQAGDEIGIFPYSPVGNSQLKYTMNEFYSVDEVIEKGYGLYSQMGMDAAGHVAGMTLGGDQDVTNTVAKFDGEGFGLIDGEKYIGYYPYDGTSAGYDEPNFCKHIPGICFDGQAQRGNANFQHLLAYDHLYLEPTTSHQKSIAMWFSHSAAIVIVNATMMPVGHKFTKARLFVEMEDCKTDSLFYKSATMDVSDWGKYAAERNANGEFDEDNQYLTLNLFDENGNPGITTTVEDRTVVAYIMVPPTYTGDRPVKVSLYDETAECWWSRYSNNTNTNMGLSYGGVNWNPNVNPIDGFCAGVIYDVWCVPQKRYDGSASTDFGVEHQYVDLGLSVKWATMNIGAIAPFDFGDYFSWGELTPKETAYNYETYRFGSHNATGSKYSKYTSDDNSAQIGVADGKLTLEPEDDIAVKYWGEEWRIPTVDEFNELCDNCIATPLVVNGVNVVKYTSTVPGYEDMYIIIPLSGVWQDTACEQQGVGEGLWSSSLGPADVQGLNSTVYCLSIKDKTTSILNRHWGRPIRPVHE